MCSDSPLRNQRGIHFSGLIGEGVECGCCCHVRIENEIINGRPDEPEDANADKCAKSGVYHLDALGDPVTEAGARFLKNRSILYRSTTKFQHWRRSILLPAGC